jgi:plasmid replication initiation protein
VTDKQGATVDDEDIPEVTREGLFRELFGKAKEQTGELIGNEHMAKEGRHLQEVAEEPPADNSSGSARTPATDERHAQACFGDPPGLSPDVRIATLAVSGRLVSGPG